MKRSFFTQFSWPIVLVVAIMFPITVWGAVLALRSNRNDVKEWLPESFQATKDYQKFQTHFGNETFVLVSWDGCTLGDRRLDALAAALSSEGRSGAPRYFQRVITGRSLLEQLTSPPERVNDFETLAG